MIYFAQETKDEYARAALATEGLSPQSVQPHGKLLIAYFPLDCEHAVRLAHDRVRRRGNELFDVFGWGQDHMTHRVYLRFTLKVQS